MARESVQQKLSRVRPPRVHITYDVDIGGAMEKKEIPFIVGVLADLSGQPEKALPPVEERSFDEIDRDNIDAMMAKHKPHLTAVVPNMLTPKKAEKKGQSSAAGGKKAESEGERAEAAEVKEKKPEENPDLLEFNLHFNSRADFRPENIVKQDPRLNKLLELRTKLFNLQNTVISNPKLASILREVVDETEKVRTAPRD